MRSQLEGVGANLSLLAHEYYTRDKGGVVEEEGRMEWAQTGGSRSMSGLGSNYQSSSSQGPESVNTGRTLGNDWVFFFWSMND